MADISMLADYLVVASCVLRTISSCLSQMCLSRNFNHLTLKHHFTDHHEEAVSPLRCQLLAAHPVLLVSGLGLLHDPR